MGKGNKHEKNRRFVIILQISLPKITSKLIEWWIYKLVNIQESNEQKEIQVTLIRRKITYYRRIGIKMLIWEFIKTKELT